MTLETVGRRPVPQHLHKVGLLADREQCPYCGQPISRKEFKEIQVRIEVEERARIAKVEQALKDRFAREKAQAAAQAKAAVEKAKRKAAKATEQQIKALQANQAAVIKARLDAERDAAAKKLAEAVSAEKVRAFEEKTKLTEQLADMQRRLEKKTAHELGEPAELNLYETLRAEFPGDRTARVAKGVKGPDIIFEVVHNGAVTGSIAIDGKNHRRWQNGFTAKLRADQLAEGADFAILSTSVFPAGAMQLLIRDHVIVANPARVVVLVHLLRRQIIQNYALKLSVEARNEKADRLYDFIISPACADILNRIVKLTDAMVDLDRTETATHQKTWAKRADLIRGVQELNGEFAGELDRIIGVSASAHMPIE